MVDPGVGLMFATPDGPVKSQVDGLVVVADEVEQAPDLAGGEPDQAAGPARGGRGCVLWSYFPVWVVLCGQVAGVVHRWRVPFLDLCLMTARKARASMARVMCRYQAW